MLKKLVTTSGIVVALGFLFTVSLASGSPVLTNGGVAIPVGTDLTGKNTGEIRFTTGPFVLTCTAANLTGKITTNSGNQFAMEVPAGAFTFAGTGGGNCTSTQGAYSVSWGTLCLQTITKTDNISITGCSGAPATSTTTISGGIVCKYSIASLTATFQTTRDATVNVAEQGVRNEEGFACTSPYKLDFDLDLTTLAGGTLLIS
jgi:hypothetical protein